MVYNVYKYYFRNNRICGGRYLKDKDFCFCYLYFYNLNKWLLSRELRVCKYFFEYVV